MLSDTSFVLFGPPTGVEGLEPERKLYTFRPLARKPDSTNWTWRLCRPSR